MFRSRITCEAGLLALCVLARPQLPAQGVQWIQWSVNQHWYRLTTEHGTWDEANSEAQAARGYLATISDEGENAWLTATFNDTFTRASGGEIPGNNLAWIGYRRDGTDWGWANGEPVTYTNCLCQYSGVHAYLHGGNHATTPGKWNNNPTHDDQFTDNLRGIIEIDEPPPGGALSCMEPQKLTAPGGGTLDHFSIVAVDGATAVIGAPNFGNLGGCCGDQAGVGRAFVFERTGDTWTHAATLVPSDGAPDDEFGGVVAIKGDWIAVAAKQHAAFTGAVYLFKKPATGWAGELQETQKLTASDGQARDQFGCCGLVIDGNRLAVGAAIGGDRGLESGSAYVFELEGESWVERQKLTGSETSTGSRFGISVDLSGDILAVGADVDGRSGAVYLFRNQAGVFLETQRVGADAVPGDRFGYSLDLAGDGKTLAVGAFQAQSNRGAVYVFEQGEAGWDKIATLLASDGETGDWLGVSVALAGDRIVAGAPRDDVGDDVDRGSACVFLRPDDGWKDGTETAKLLAGDGGADDWFGSDVAAEAQVILVGASRDDARGEKSGAVYAFSCPPISPPPKLSLGETDLRCRGEVPVRMTNPLPVAGFEFRVCYPSDLVVLEAINLGTVWDALGYAPDVWDPRIVDGTCEGGTRARLSAIISMGEPLRTLPPGEDQEIATLRFRAKTVGEAPIRFEPGAVVSVLVAGVPEAQTPETEDGVLRVTSVCFVRGDADENGRIDINDPITLLYYLFRGISLSCLDAADADDSGDLNIVDAIYLIDFWVRRTGPPPPPPFLLDPDGQWTAACGADETEGDPLGCDQYPPCAGDPQ